jgi:hypothetical protein
MPIVSRARGLLAFGLVTAALVAPVGAQDEAALRKAFEGARVMVRIDMPGDVSGVDIRPGSPFDSSQQRDRLKRYPTALHVGDLVTVTLVKVKKDLIEFHLNGGGYGAYGDDTSTSANLPDVQKSNRELDLEKAVKAEADPTKRRTLERELEDLKNARERENRRIAAERNVIETQKKTQVTERRLGGGSRFNIRYSRTVPAGLDSAGVREALAEFVDFAPRPDAGGTALGQAPADTLPRKGMWRTEAERAFGRPVESTDRREGALRVSTLVFVHGDHRITAEFVEDVLIRYTVTPRGQN